MSQWEQSILNYITAIEEMYKNINQNAMEDEILKKKCYFFLNKRLGIHMLLR